MVALTEKKTPNAAYHSTKKIFWGSVPTSEARCSLKSAVWRGIERVHQSANDKRTTWPPAAGSAWKSCFDQLGHERSVVIIERCAACPWISAIFPGGRHYFSPHKMAKKITDYRDTPALTFFLRRAFHFGKSINLAIEKTLASWSRKKGGKFQQNVSNWAKLVKVNVNYKGSAEALSILCVRCARWEREREREREIQRERERERRKWCHHCRAKFGEEFCTFPCQKFASYRPLYWRRV